MKHTITLVTALLLSPLVGLHAAGQPKPNIIVILADDLGFTDLGCQGSPDVTSTRRRPMVCAARRVI